MAFGFGDEREPFQQEALLCAGSSVQVGEGRGDGGRGTAQPHPVETVTKAPETSSHLTVLLPLQGQPSAQGPGDVLILLVCFLGIVAPSQGTKMKVTKNKNVNKHLEKLFKLTYKQKLQVEKMPLFLMKRNIFQRPQSSSG